MTDTASAAPSEREKFEAWAQSLGLAHESNDPSAMWTWAAWQAARAQPTPPAAVESLTEEAIAVWIHHACRSGLYPVISGTVPFRGELWPMLIEFARDHGIGIKKENGNA